MTTARWNTNIFMHNNIINNIIIIFNEAESDIFKLLRAFVNKSAVTNR